MTVYSRSFASTCVVLQRWSAMGYDFATMVYAYTMINLFCNCSLVDVSLISIVCATRVILKCIYRKKCPMFFVKAESCEPGFNVIE